MTKKVLVLSLVLAAGVLVLSGCGHQPFDPSAFVPKSVVFEREIGLNEEVVIDFLIRDNRGVPEKFAKQPLTTKEEEKYVKISTGKATYKFKEVGLTEELAKYKAPADQIYYYAIYDVLGDSVNLVSVEDSNRGCFNLPIRSDIDPSNFSDTPSAPYVTFLEFRDGGYYSPSSCSSGGGNDAYLLISRGVNLGGMILSECPGVGYSNYPYLLNGTTWKTDARVEKCSRGVNPVVAALKYVNLAGEVKYIKINQ